MLLILDCTNEVHDFYYDSKDFYEEKTPGSPRWNLPLSNLFHAMTLIFFSASTIITPLGYGAIYRFRRKQDDRVSGISSMVRKQRKNRNLVTMKFNMFNWILDTISTLLVMIVNPVKYFTLLYILVISCGTPLVYFMGIEENRNMAKEYIKLNMRIFQKKNKIKTVTVDNSTSTTDK